MGSWKSALTMLRPTWYSQSIPYLAEARLQIEGMAKRSTQLGKPDIFPLGVSENCHLKMNRQRHQEIYTS